jgi:hypothetical protein
MINKKFKTSCIYTLLLVYCAGVGAGCNILGSHGRHSHSPTFARTFSIEYQGKMAKTVSSQAVATDGKGGAVITGFFQAPNHIHIFVVHIDKQGKLLWQKTFASKLDDRAYDIVRAKNGDFVITGFKHNNKLYLLRINGQGQVIWQYTYRRVHKPSANPLKAEFSHDFGYAITQTPDGGFAVTGRTIVNSSPHYWYMQAYEAPSILRVNAKGQRLWFKYYSNNIFTRGRAFGIVPGPNGGLLVCGIYASYWPFRITKKGALEKPVMKGLPAHVTYTDIIKLKDGNYAMCGDIFNIRVTKLGSDGQSEIWSNIYGNGEVNALVQTHDGGIVAAGSLVEKNGQHKPYFFKLNADGKVIWKRKPNLIGSSTLNNVQQTKNGDLILVGSIYDKYMPTTPLIIRADSLGHIRHIAQDLKPISK